MKFYSIASICVFLFTFCCYSNKTPSMQTAEEKMNILKFSATFQSTEILALQEAEHYGKHYEQNQLQRQMDTCELTVGHDANYKLYLTNVEFSVNKINLYTPDTLVLRIHSPSKIFLDEPEKGKVYTFNLEYYISNKTDVVFIFLNIDTE